MEAAPAAATAVQSVWHRLEASGERHQRLQAAIKSRKEELKKLHRAHSKAPAKKAHQNRKDKLASELKLLKQGIFPSERQQASTRWPRAREG